VTCDDRTITRADLESRANRLARAYADLGVRQGDLVTVALANSIEFYEVCCAVWKLGATPQPVSWRLPDRERQAIVELAQPAIVVGAPSSAHPGRTCLPAGFEPPAGLEDGPLADAVAPSLKAPTSGGSTGRPKLILSGDRGVIDPDATPALFMERDRCQVVPGPLYHNGPFLFSMLGLFHGNHIVVEPRFEAETTLQLIERHSCDWIFLVPTMMNRIWRLPESVRRAHDLSSLRILFHLAAPCPPWLKEAFIEWLGPERIWELYAGTEAQAMTLISGQEWLSHLGSVGRPVMGEMKVLGPSGEQLAPGEVGEVWMRPPPDRDRPTYEYRGASARRADGGWESLGDLGWMDEDGYLYLSDRRVDLILSGGANIYPAEVEAALEEHPEIEDCVVIGLPDEDLGQRVHAIIHVQDVTAAPSDESLRAFLGERLVRYKVPRTFEFVTAPLRDEAGKVRRWALRDERAGASWDPRGRGSPPVSTY
jgi:bile acid-coenzyme A ligase